MAFTSYNKRKQVLKVAIGAILNKKSKKTCRSVFLSVTNPPTFCFYLDIFGTMPGVEATVFISKPVFEYNCQCAT